MSSLSTTKRIEHICEPNFEAILIFGSIISEYDVQINKEER